MPFTFNPDAPAFAFNPAAAAFQPSQFCSASTPSTSVGADSPNSSIASLTDGVIATEADVRQACANLAREQILFLDCEGADLSKGSWLHGKLQTEAGAHGEHGRLCLIQIGTVRGEVYAIDTYELGQAAFDLGLRQILEDPAITKVVHDFRQDSDALLHQFMVRPQSLFDTQLCEVLIRRLKGVRTTYVQGSAKLVANHGIEAQRIPGYGLLTQEQKLIIHERFAQDRHLWERRPIPEDMVLYAKADVLPLPQLHQKLVQELATLLGDEATANYLVLAGSKIYAAQFAEKTACRCRLCCNAAEAAKFDGCLVFSRLAESREQWMQQVLQRLWREEDAYPLPTPGPSKFYINDRDESVPIPGRR